MFDSLFSGLPADDQQEVVRLIQRTRDAQLGRKLSPPRRRRRDADGVLKMPEALA